MDETQLAAWQAALVEALLGGGDVAGVRARLRAALPWAEPWIVGLDDRAIAVAQDLVHRWSPHAASTRDAGERTIP
jgi:hypothetical protein